MKDSVPFAGHPLSPTGTLMTHFGPLMPSLWDMRQFCLAP
jgi:hypothetical protein